MTQLIDWYSVCDPKFVISDKHRQHQRRMHLQQHAVARRRELHAQRRWNPIRPYGGQLY
jgi:hypothetical protein